MKQLLYTCIVDIPLEAYIFFIIIFDVKTQTVFQVNSPAVSIDGHENVPANDENALMKAVANQPVSVAIDASGIDFQLYSKVVMITILKSCLHVCCFNEIVINFMPKFDI